LHFIEEKDITITSVFLCKYFMESSPLPSHIGPYEIIQSLGKGGMGEVFLVKDPLCERKLALKKILPELSKYSIIKERFLREARFAAKLSHPCIIPIHTICLEPEIYYTMPYVEGETLKEIFKNTLENEKLGLPPHKIGTSIPSLVRIFLSVCQATAYAYSKSILHRDLKPENIIVGKYGEVFLLDWGIATHLDHMEEETDLFEVKEEEHLTRPGKVLGTVNFMAPERALKKAATIVSEIYALGTILYQILTLRLPFTRKNLEHFRKIMPFETLLPPEEAAPYRDIPKQLSSIAQKCLARDPKERYQSVDEVLFDLDNYIEGRPEWVLSTRLDIENKDDWEFQENVLLSKSLAISRLVDVREWVGFMISKESFSGNFKLEFELKLPKESEGVGFLLCIPEPSKRKSLEEGYCLWLGSASRPYTTLFRSNAEIMSIPDNDLHPNRFNHLCLERIDQHIRVYINGQLKLSYSSHLPMIGTHLGFVYKNPDFSLSPIKVYVGSQNVMVNCLCIPDAFLASQHFDKALQEYERIAYSFSGRSEGREALFRWGITLLEQGKRERLKLKQEHLFSKALEVFEKLGATPAAPLEYLGKSLVYYAMQDLDEELKCLELTLRKYPKHPLLSVVKEQVLFRLHETSQQNRLATYGFALLILRHMQSSLASPTHHDLINYLMQQNTPLTFIDTHIRFSDQKTSYLYQAITLSFWLHKPLILTEILESLPSELAEKPYILASGIFCLLHMQEGTLALETLENQAPLLRDFELHFYLEPIKGWLKVASCLSCLECLLEKMQQPITLHFLRSFTFLIEEGLKKESPSILLPFVERLYRCPLKHEQKHWLLALYIKLLLLLENFKEASLLFQEIPEELLHQVESPFYFLYGCYLWKTEGEAIALEHFILATQHPSLHPHALVALYLTQTEEALPKLFLWEKRDLYQKLSFLYTLLGKKRKLSELEKKSKKLSLS